VTRGLILVLGNHACHFTTLCRDFLMSRELFLCQNHRMAMQLKNLARLGTQRRVAIHRQADDTR
jgi:deoxyribodipyrimidine photolyase-related protein